MVTVIIIVLGSVFGICSTIWLIEWMYDRRAEKNKNAIRHFHWLSSKGLYESARIVDPRHYSKRNFG